VLKFPMLEAAVPPSRFNDGVHLLQYVESVPLTSDKGEVHLVRVSGEVDDQHCQQAQAQCCFQA
jgi:hypothetical protein